MWLLLAVLGFAIGVIANVRGLMLALAAAAATLLFSAPLSGWAARLPTCVQVLVVLQLSFAAALALQVWLARRRERSGRRLRIPLQ